MASLVHRERRSLWIALAIGFTAVAVAGTLLAARARTTAVDQGKAAAVTAARGAVTPILSARWLDRPAAGRRAQQLRAEIAAALGSGAFTGARVFGVDGRILLDDPARGRTAADASAEVSDAADGRVATIFVDGAFTAYVPTRPASGTGLRVVELTAARGRFAPAGHWGAAVPVAAVVVLLCLAMTAITARATGTTTPRASLYQPAIPRRPRAATALTPTAPTGSVFAVDERSMLEARLRESHARAQEAEESFRSVQSQLKDALAHLKDLEGRLTVEQTQSGTAQGELDTLRTQVRETSERLHQAENENDRLRERMAMRQHELEELRHTIATSTPSDSELDELRLRLETAENAAAALSRELDRVEQELEHTRSRFHMAMLSEALREFDNDALEIEHDDPLDHTVVIRNGSTVTSPTTRR